MSVQRYDTRGPAGDFVERYWQPINTPIRDTDGRLVFLLHHVEYVSDQVTRPSSVVLEVEVPARTFDVAQCNNRCPT
jgi:hypothetical protein